MDAGPLIALIWRLGRLFYCTELTPVHITCAAPAASMRPIQPTRCEPSCTLWSTFLCNRKNPGTCLRLHGRGADCILTVQAQSLEQPFTQQFTCGRRDRVAGSEL